MVRRFGEASDAAGGENGSFRFSPRPLRPRRQEDEEREALQGLVREREAEAGEEDREDQGQGRGPQVHSLASPLQTHLISPFSPLHTLIYSLPLGLGFYCIFPLYMDCFYRMYHVRLVFHMKMDLI